VAFVEPEQQASEFGRVAVRVAVECEFAARIVVEAVAAVGTASCRRGSQKLAVAVDDVEVEPARRVGSSESRQVAAAEVAGLHDQS
jgi:hypothetical protein